jgi:hypothetical protein
LKLREETKLLPDSAFGNSLCMYKPKSEKPFFYSPGGDPSTGSQVCPGTLKRFRTPPSL